MRRQIVTARVIDTQKRRVPSKHYVYIIKASWNDGSETVIYRRYSKFFDLQVSLLESFPLEGGLKDPSKRIIPFLPGKILFRRSHIREVAIKRLKPIDEYCEGLCKLPHHIVQSDLVLNFFESKPEDINPLLGYFKKKQEVKGIGEISGPIHLVQYRVKEDYDRTEAKELSVKAGQLIDVIEKQENGWWFVTDQEGERGWVPGAYLERSDGVAENLITDKAAIGLGENYTTTTAFTGGPGEVSFPMGVMIEVLEKNLEGWWLVSYLGKQGRVPAAYLEKTTEARLRHAGNSHASGSNNWASQRPKSVDASAFNRVDDISPLHAPATRVFSDDRSMMPAYRDVKRKRSASQRAPPKLKPKVPPPLPPPMACKMFTAETNDPIYEYVTVADFNTTIPQGIDLKQHEIIKVLEKSPGDWWYVSVGKREGWAPSCYIEKRMTSGEVENNGAAKAKEGSDDCSIEEEMMKRFAFLAAKSKSASAILPSQSTAKKASPVVPPKKPSLAAPDRLRSTAAAISGDGNRSHRPMTKAISDASSATVVSKRQALANINFAVQRQQQANHRPRSMLPTATDQRIVAAKKLPTNAIGGERKSEAKPAVPSKPVLKSRHSSPNIKNKIAAFQSKLGTATEAPSVAHKPPKSRQLMEAKTSSHPCSNANNNSWDDMAPTTTHHPQRRGSPDGQISTVVADADERVVAIHNFQPIGPTELGFCAGEVARVLETSDDWHFVEIVAAPQRSGWVPRNHFRTSHPPDGYHVTAAAACDDDAVYSEIDVVASGDGYVAKFDYEDSDKHATTLRVARGDQLHVVDASTNADWWFVKIVRSSRGADVGKEGWIPSSCVSTTLT